MNERGIPKALLVASVLLDLAILLFFLFMPRSGMEALAFAFVQFPMIVIRAALAAGCLYLCVTRRRWPWAVYTIAAMALIAWFWFVGAGLKPTTDPLHQVLRDRARQGRTHIEERLRSQAYDRRRARQARADPDHGRLCDLLAERRDLSALRAHPLQDPDRPCTTLRGVEVSPLMHAVTHSYGAWSGGERPHAPVDEAFLAPAAQRLLTAGADPDARDEYGNTALHYALIFRNEALLDVLLDADACLLLPNALGETPLATHSSGSLRRKVEAAANDPEALRHCPADLRPTAPAAATPDAAPNPDLALLRALRSGRLERAMDLLARGADPDALDREGSSFEAALRNCRGNSLTLAQVLLDAGADIDLGNERGHTALRIAFDHCRRALPFLLERGADPNVPDRRGDTLLHYLSSAGEETVEPLLDRLLAAGAAVDRANRAGQTPLLRAAHAAADRLVVALLERGADPELADQGGNTALHLLARRPLRPGTLPALDALLTRAPDLERRNARGETPLISAVEHGDAAVVRRLLAAGADADVRRPRGSPLLTSLLSCDPEELAKLEMLLAAGADPAAHREHAHLPLAQALYGKLYLDCLAPAELLLAAGADPDLRDRNGGAPIHSLAYWSEKDPGPALALLAAHDAEIDLRNDQGLTALLLAARGGSSLRTLERLVEHGADPRARDARGNTLLHHLAGNREAELEARIAWALALGADPRARNDAGRTPLERARQLRNAAAVRMLEAP